MTAPEPTPTAEHIDAVARAVDPDIFDPSVKRSTHPAAVVQIAARKHMASEAARNVLTSTDPAVHLATLDALVRAGVLTVDLMTLSDGYAGRLVTEWGAADLGGNAPEVAP